MEIDFVVAASIKKNWLFCNEHLYFFFQIKAIEITDETRTGEVEVNIKLIALNDESPIFEKPEYEFRQRNIHP